MKLKWNISYLLYVTVIAGLLLLALFCFEARYPLANFTRDPMAVSNGKPYYGFVSNISILFWCATASICLYSWCLKRWIGQTEGLYFLFFSFALTTVLLLDDLFMLHEYVFPKMMGIRQRYVIFIYMLITVAYLFSFRKQIIGRHATKLMAAFGFFVVSLFVDLFPLGSNQWQYLVEDGAKLLGIVSWFNYFVHVCKEQLVLGLHEHNTQFTH